MVGIQILTVLAKLCKYLYRGVANKKSVRGILININLNKASLSLDICWKGRILAVYRNVNVLASLKIIIDRD